MPPIRPDTNRADLEVPCRREGGRVAPTIGTLVAAPATSPHSCRVTRSEVGGFFAQPARSS